MNFVSIWREALAAAAILALITGVIARRAARLKTGRALLWAGLSGYLALLIATVFFPLPPFEGPMPLAELSAAIVTDPVEPLLYSARIALESRAAGDLRPMQLFVANTAGNLVLLMPLAFFLRRLGRLPAHTVLLITVLVSLCIEGGQVALNYLSGIPARIVDINDLILNTAGVVLLLPALAIGDAIRRARTRRPGRSANARSGRRSGAAGRYRHRTGGRR